MRNLVLFFVLALLASGCFLFRDYKRREFSYTQNGQAQRLPLIAPKGFTKEEVTDTAGIRLHSFRYPGGAVLYAAYLADTSYELQPFPKDLHQPLALRTGGRVYKGQNEQELFYREIRQGNFRFGYYGVPAANETYFDSATNYPAWRVR